ncbi:MAG: hypothetical protein E6G68_04450 [Actinobacteria bacterium]|nr:MAG: hypothetical protein E6G68_04450 [Actinomycetota bacterium]
MQDLRRHFHAVRLELLEELRTEPGRFHLADLAPKLTGPKALNGLALEKEVKATLDRILRREDVKVSPIERQKFLNEVLSDTLGYGPLDAV